MAVFLPGTERERERERERAREREREREREGEGERERREREGGSRAFWISYCWLPRSLQLASSQGVGRTNYIPIVGCWNPSMNHQVAKNITRTPVFFQEHLVKLGFPLVHSLKPTK